MIISKTYFVGDEDIEVVLSANVHTEKPSMHEYGDDIKIAPGYDYIDEDGIVFERSEYTVEQVQIIDGWIERNEKRLYDEFYKLYRDE